MANLPLVIELCKTSEKLQEAFIQINAAREESEKLRECLRVVSLHTSELSRALAASEARVQELQGERDLLSLLVTSFQYTKALTESNQESAETGELYVP